MASQRELVKELIETGEYTKAAIAEKLDMSAGSVSTQMTYLRWMGLFIATNPETKILTFCSQEEFEAMEAEKKAKAKTKTTSIKAPQERYDAVVKTIANQEKALEKWQTKVTDAQAVLEDHPDDEDVLLSLKEAEAMVIVTEVKLARNNKLMDELANLEEVDTTPAEEDEAVEPEDELL